jgi:hypothetical protein
MARLARRASTTTGCEKLGRQFAVGLNGVRGSGLVLDDVSEDSLQTPRGLRLPRPRKFGIHIQPT